MPSFVYVLIARNKSGRTRTYVGWTLDLDRRLKEHNGGGKAGAKFIQIDEPYYSGFPEDLPWAVKAINAAVEGVNVNVTLHICYGNRYGKPSFEGSYKYLFPTILDAKVHGLSLEFARRGASVVVNDVGSTMHGQGADLNATVFEDRLLTESRGRDPPNERCEGLPERGTVATDPD